MKNLTASDKAMERIKKEQVTVLPKWRFLLKDATVWTFFALTIIIGSLGTSAMLFLITIEDWDIYRYLNKSFIEYVLLSLPYLWIFFIFLFVLLAYYNARHTKHGYRFRGYWLAGISIFASAAIGLGLNYLGVGAKLDSMFAKNLPIYEKMTQHHVYNWSLPEFGLLGGRIIEIKSEREFVLEGFDARMWNILSDRPRTNFRIKIRPDENIKIIGKIIGDGAFKADEIRPWYMVRMHPRMMMHMELRGNFER